MKKRTKDVLFLIINNYIKTSLPVSSFRILEEGNFNCSSATIRNEMIELEKKGYIEKPHTSSGRVPTSKGYEYYASNSSESQEFTKLIQMIDEIFSNRASSIESTIEQTCSLVSEVLNLPIALFQKKNKKMKAMLQSIQLFKISEEKSMIIIVADNEVVLESIIDIPKDSFNDLKLALNIISKRLNHVPLSEVLGRLSLITPILSEHIRNFEKKLKEIVVSVFDKALRSVRVYGSQSITKLPEANDEHTLKALVSLLDTKNIWKVLTGTFTPIDDDGTDLGFIKEGLSIVKIALAQEDTYMAVVSPNRADYMKIMTALKSIKGNLAKKQNLLGYDPIDKYINEIKLKEE